MDSAAVYTYLSEKWEMVQAAGAGRELPVSLEAVLGLAEGVLATMAPGPENHATAVALRDARAWQAARRAVVAAAGGKPASGLGWEEI